MRTRLLIAAALLGALLAVPATADAAKRKVPQRFFGVMWDKEIGEAPNKLQSRQFAKMAVNGVETSRAVFSWYLAEGRPGRISYRYTDQIVRNAARHGIEVLPVVTYAPPWARVQERALGSAPRPEHYGAYVEYLKLLVARYGPRGQFWKDNPKIPRRPVRAWQIWNEPHVEYQWSPQENWQARYGELLRMAYPAVKEVDPRGKVVLAGIANASWDLLATMYEQGRIKGSFDVMAVHYYEKTSHEFVEVSRRVRETLDGNGDRRVPIWWTEAGASASQGRIRARGAEHFQTTDRGMARHLTRTYKLLVRQRRKLRIERVYWYTWASSYGKNVGVFEYSGLNVFQGRKVKPKPSLAAYRDIARRYQGCRKDRRARCVRR